MRFTSILLLASIMSASSLYASGSHAETHESGWFAYQYNDDDSVVLYCTALGLVPLGANLYLWGASAQDGHGIWVIEEINGIPGFQPSGTNVNGGFGFLLGEDPAWAECPNGDSDLIVGACPGCVL